MDYRTLSEIPKRIGLLLSVLAAMAPRLLSAQQALPIRVTVTVSEVVYAPVPNGETGDIASGPDGETINLPFKQSFSLPLRADLSIVPDVLHTQRIIAGDSDLHLELQLTPPVDGATTAKAKFFYHNSARDTEPSGGHGVYKITDPFSNEVSAIVRFDGSSVELGKRQERFGTQPNETVVFTHISLNITPPPPATQDIH